MNGDTTVTCGQVARVTIETKVLVLEVLGDFFCDKDMNCIEIAILIWDE
jgi:hypothetical protein